MPSRYTSLAPWFGLAALLAVAVGHWRMIENPQMGFLWLAVMLAVAIAPSAVTLYAGRWAGIGTLVVSIVLAFGITSGLWPGFSGHHTYPSAVWLRINDGAHAWFNATTPFDVDRFPTVDTDARLLLMLGVAVLAYTALVRRWALISIAVALAILAFPATVVNLNRPWLHATMFLIAALIALRTIPRYSAKRSAGWGQAWALGAAVVVLGVTLSALPGVAKGAFLGWHTWNPLAAEAKPRSLSYVWNQTYAPLHWKGKPTEVLAVWSKRPMYWRVATLEDWTGTAWAGGANPLVTSGDSDSSPVKVPAYALPSNARHARRADVANVRVQVLALADDHLVSAAQTLEWIAPQAPPYTLQTDGSAKTDSAPDRGLIYTSHVYAADPTPKQLGSATGPLPPVVRQTDLTVGRQLMPRWPAPTEDAARAAVDASLLKASDQVWARSGAATAANQWAAAADVEAYLRARPFRYDLTPRFSGHEPVLAQFMLSVKAGYCQMFSGSMALVLRLHGIPTRVAVGFTPGVRTSLTGPYQVTDRDAHSWVEVYFPGYGWQPFDPTPTRHLPVLGSTSSALYKVYERTASGAAALTGIGLLNHANGVKGSGVNPGDARHHPDNGTPGGPRSGRGGEPPPVAQTQSGGHGFFTWVFGLVAAALVLIWHRQVRGGAVALPAARSAGAGVGCLPRTLHVRGRPGGGRLAGTHLRGALRRDPPVLRSRRLDIRRPCQPGPLRAAGPGCRGRP